MKNLFRIPFKVTSFLLLAVAASSQSATAGVINSNRAVSDYVNHLKSNTAYESVGKLLINDGASNSDWASAVNIGNGYVVTAAHFLENIDSLSLVIGGNTYHVDDVDKDVKIHSWSGNALDGNDIALIKFQDGLGDAEVAKIWDGSADFLTEKVVTNVGFSRTGNGIDGIDESSDVIKLAGQNEIDFFGPAFLGISENTMVQTFDQNRLDLEYLTARGDSGGGVFFDHNNETYLVGINSFVNAISGEDDVYGASINSTSLHAYRDWINTTTGIGKPVPEPASFALFGLGLAGIFFVKRRRA